MAGETAPSRLKQNYIAFKSCFLPLSDSQASVLVASCMERAREHYSKADASDPKSIQSVPTLDYSIQLSGIASQLFKAARLLMKAQTHAQAHPSAESDLNGIYREASKVIYHLKSLGFNVYSHRCGVLADNVILRRSALEKMETSVAFTDYDEIYEMAGRLAEAVGNKSAASKVYRERAEIAVKMSPDSADLQKKIRELAIKGYEYAPDYEKEEVASRLAWHCSYDVKSDKFVR